MKKSITKIKLHSIYKSFKVQGQNKLVLNGISLDVKKGKFISIVGPSGCGKTTLLNIIAGLENQDKGIIKLASIKADQRLGKIGLMQQKDLLFPWRTVIGNATLGLELKGVSKNVSRQKALDLIETFGLKGFENQYPSILSGGMRQRLSFLRTVLLNQDIMLLDEPFGALDNFTRIKMRGWLESLWKTFNKTIVLVTHDIEEAILLSDRIYMLSVRPAKVTAMLNVDLVRPRHYKMVTTRDFVGLKKILISALNNE